LDATRLSDVVGTLAARGGPVLTDGEVRKLHELRGEGKSMPRVALRLGCSKGTVRRYVRAGPGSLPSAMKKPRDWRTRADPFAEVWATVVPWLEGEAESDEVCSEEFEAKTLFDWLCDENPGKFQEGQLRTFQRRVRDYRALHGSKKEVFFAQLHRPGEKAESDFTEMKSLGITIAGVPFDHLVYHFVLDYSNWEYVEIAVSESYAALSQGLQNALWTLGGAPCEHRTDNLTAATHDLKKEEGRAFNERFLGLVSHYGMTPSTNNAGEGHENGDVEKSHDVFKRAVRQRLLLRRSRDFASREEYEAFLDSVVAGKNARRAERFEEERLTLKSLPARRLDDVQILEAVVTKWSTVQALRNTYSVPSRLIGYDVNVHVHAEHLEVFYGSALIERIDRLRGTQSARINYRHLIHSLIKKPGAFDDYRYRDELFPSVVFRRAYDALRAAVPHRATLEYLRLLKLAAETLETDVASGLERLLAEGQVPESERVKQLVAPTPIACPNVAVSEPEIKEYDELFLEAV
jgi:transposase